MDKKDLASSIQTWLKNFLIKKYSDIYDVVDIIIPESSLSKLPIAQIKLCENYSSWDFKPDILGILKNKKNSNIELVLVNRATSSLSLKEIGEMYCYSKLVNSKLSLLISLNGVSNEVGILLVDEKIRKKVLNYSAEREIIICSWDEDKDMINDNLVIPLYMKRFIMS